MSEIQNQINQLIENREMARMGGGQKAIDKQHEKGKYTARERIQMLLDEGSFEEFDMFVTHRCYDFGMEKKHTFGDGVALGTFLLAGHLAGLMSFGIPYLMPFVGKGLAGYHAPKDSVSRRLWLRPSDVPV